jgi:hypothetical protein
MLEIEKEGPLFLPNSEDWMGPQPNSTVRNSDTRTEHARRLRVGGEGELRQWRGRRRRRRRRRCLFAHSLLQPLLLSVNSAIGCTASPLSHGSGRNLIRLPRPVQYSVDLKSCCVL